MKTKHEQRGTMNYYMLGVALAATFLACQPVGASNWEAILSKRQNDSQQEYIAPFKSVFVRFWDKDLENYHLHAVVRKLIDQIHHQEMLDFLTKKGVTLDPRDILTSDNLISYLRYKGIGTEAAYAWIDLQKGSPDFVTAVMDWQAIQKEYGYEFIPTYYLLYQAKLETKRDAEVWLELYQATYHNFSKRDQDKKTLLLLCLMPRVWRDLKPVEPSLSKRLAFLAEEIKTPNDLSGPYAQALIFCLYGAHQVSQEYIQAASYGRMLKPKSTSLFFTFMAQALGKDLAAAKATLTEMSALPTHDEQMIKVCREMVQELEKMEKKLNQPTDKHKQ